MDTSAAIREAMDERPPLPNAAIRKALRQRAGLPQRVVANAVGVSREAITKYEAGEREPSGERRVRYAEALTEMARTP